MLKALQRGIVKGERYTQVIIPGGAMGDHRMRRNERSGLAVRPGSNVAREQPIWLKLLFTKQKIEGLRQKKDIS
jgi:hypothetical protein